MPAEDEIRDGFVRQRKSLVLISIVLFLVEMAGISVTDIDIFGIQLEVGNASAISYALWIAWFYFVLRYYQYFRDLPEKGIGPAYWGRLSTIAKGIAARKFEREMAEADEETLRLRFEPRGFTKSQVPGDWIYQFQSEIDNSEFRTVNVTTADRRIPAVRAIIHVALSTRLVSEYWLPFLIAAAPPIYALTVMIRTW